VDVRYLEEDKLILVQLIQIALAKEIVTHMINHYKFYKYIILILIFSISNDYATAEVIKRLKHLDQEVVRINRDDNVYKFYKITDKEILFKNLKQQKTYNLLNAKSCWWRRRGLSKNHFLLDKERISFKANGFNLDSLINGSWSLTSTETNDLIDFIQTKIYQTCTINIGSPWRYDLNKLKVLRIAEKYGINTPKYEIISNLNQIEHNDFSTDKFVTKAICEGVYKTTDKHHFYSYTESYNTEDFSEEKNNISIFPSLIMEQIEKELEIRSFFLDGSFYSMAIFSQINEQTKVDFRKYDEVKPNKCEAFQLPKKIEEKLKKVYKAFNLNSGSADLVLDKNGNYIFLEINPVGQYHMTSDPCNYNIDNVIANYLIRG
jgi:ATP-GRASP peptide maturase of grasp-with-spasm system